MLQCQTFTAEIKQTSIVSVSPPSHTHSLSLHNHHLTINKYKHLSLLMISLKFIHTTRIHTGVIAVYTGIKQHRTWRVMFLTQAWLINTHQSMFDPWCTTATVTACFYCSVWRSTKYDWAVWNFTAKSQQMLEPPAHPTLEYIHLLI